MARDSEPSTSGHERWPDFLLIGPQRTGTTSTYSYLGSHPQVCMCDDKEPFYFVPYVWDRRHDEHHGTPEGVAKYLGLFDPAAEDQLLGETTPGYISDPEAPARIASQLPGVSLVTILRDPVQRAFSHYLKRRRTGFEPSDDFEHAVRQELRDRRIDPDGVQPPTYDTTLRAVTSDRSYVAGGCYYTNLRRYLDRFDRDQILVLSFPDLTRKTDDVLRRICDFLDIERDPVREIDTSVNHNPYATPRNKLLDYLSSKEITSKVAQTVLPPSMRDRINDWILTEADKPRLPPGARELLVSVYEPEIQALEDLLGRELGYLRESWNQTPAET